MAMDEANFQRLADGVLGRFMDVIDDQLGDVLDVDLEDGILTIELADGGTYIINKHAPNRQIWLSSPLSGAAHFDYDAAADRWLSTRGGGGLEALLADELGRAAGRPFSLT